MYRTKTSHYGQVDSFIPESYIKPSSNNKLCSKASLNIGSPLLYVAFPKINLKAESIQI